MPSAEDLTGSTLEFSRVITDPPEPDVRLEVDTAGVIVSIPVMKLRMLRAGTDEAEFRLTHPAQPFEIGFVASLDKQTKPYEVSLSTSFHGFDFTRIETCVKLISAFLAGGDLRIYDLTSNRLILQARVSGDTNWLSKSLFRLIEVGALIERKFNVSVPWPSQVTHEDAEKLHVLNCLISGKELGTNLRLTAMCPKNPSLVEQAENWENGPSMLFFEPSDHQKISFLFGVNLEVPAWGMYTEHVRPADSQATLTDVQEALEGTVVPIVLQGLSPTYVRFTDSFS